MTPEAAFQAQVEPIAAFDVVLVGLPPLALSQNARGRWSGRSKLVKEWRETAYWKAQERLGQAILVGWPKEQALLNAQHGEWAVTFHIKGRFARDEDNAISRCKVILDGIFVGLMRGQTLTNRGLLGRDDREHLRMYAPPEFVRSDRAETVVHVRLYE